MKIYASRDYEAATVSELFPVTHFEVGAHTGHPDENMEISGWTIRYGQMLTIENVCGYCPLWDLLKFNQLPHKQRARLLTNLTMWVYNEVFRNTFKAPACELGLTEDQLATIVATIDKAKQKQRRKPKSAHQADSTKPAPRIVCAAARSPCGVLVVSPRHFDRTMHALCDKLDPNIDWANSEQGFVDQFGDFHTRSAAYIIAVDNGQLRRRPGGYDGSELFSEDLY